MGRFAIRMAMMLISVGVVAFFVFGCGTRIGTDETANARIVVEVVPVRALVLIDEKPMLRTRVGEVQSVTLDPGFHRIEIEAAGFHTYRREAVLDGGEVLELDVEMWPNVPELD